MTEIKELKPIVEILKAKMKADGITQRQVAEAIGATEVSMSRWMRSNRKMPFEMVAKMANFLGYKIYIDKIGWPYNPYQE